MAQADPLLALLLNSPGEKPATPRDLARFRGDSSLGLVLASNGVYWLQKAGQVRQWLEGGVKVYAMAKDLQARGLPAPPEDIELISEAELVGLLMDRYLRSVTL